jgi:hypothetical protein
MGLGRPVFYCNSRVEGLLKKQLRKAASSTIRMDDITENRKVLSFDGVPIKRCDSILNTESAVTYS